MIEDVIRERQVRERLEKLDMPELVDERIEHEDRIESLENQNEKLRQALERIISDHDERVSMYGERELQPNRALVMEAAREALREVDND